MENTESHSAEWNNTCYEPMKRSKIKRFIYKHFIYEVMPCKVLSPISESSI